MTGTIAPVRPDRGAARDAVNAGAEIFAPPLVDVERRADGAMVLRSPVPLREPAASLCVLLDRWAREAPDRTFLAERAGAPAGVDWRTLTYREARARARGVAQALLDRRLDPERPILILAEN